MSVEPHIEPRCSPIARAWRLGDHLSIWQTLYTLALGAMIVQTTTGARWTSPGATLTLALSAHALFLLDRVKLRAADLDPADAAASPERDRLVRRFGTPLRALIGAELIAGVGVAAAMLSWSAATLIALGLVGVVLYGERPAGAHGAGRLKDVPLLKNLCVSLGLVALAMVVEIPVDRWLSLRPWEVAGAGALIVLGDAVLCDLDDADADRAFGVRTLPVVLGRGPATILALTCLGTAAFPLTLGGGNASSASRLIWAIGAPASAAAVLFLRPRGVKAPIDARLFPLAIAAALVA